MYIDYENGQATLDLNDGRVITTLFQHVRLLHPTLTQEELDETPEYMAVRRALREFGHGAENGFVTYSLNKNEEGWEGRLAQFFAKDEQIVAITMVEKA